MNVYLARSTRYLPMMKNTLRENGLPEDLVYVSLIESGFSGVAHSHSNAVGIGNLFAPLENAMACMSMVLSMNAKIRFYLRVQRLNISKSSTVSSAHGIFHWLLTMPVKIA